MEGSLAEIYIAGNVYAVVVYFSRKVFGRLGCISVTVSKKDGVNIGSGKGSIPIQVDFIFICGDFGSFCPCNIYQGASYIGSSGNGTAEAPEMVPPV